VRQQAGVRAEVSPGRPTDLGGRPDGPLRRVSHGRARGKAVLTTRRLKEYSPPDAPPFCLTRLAPA